MSIESELKIEIGKIKGNLERLKKEIKIEKLNRNTCYSILCELKSSFLKIEFYFLEPGMDIITKQLRINNLSIEDQQTWNKMLKAIEVFIKPLISKIDFIIRNIYSSRSYKDEYARRDMGDLITLSDSALVIIHREILSLLSLSLIGLSQIAELITMKPEFIENWATATCYLSAMEACVNKKREELGLKKETKKFKEKFRELLEALQEKGLKVSELEKELPPIFWNIRHKVVHAGYSPSNEELELIITWVKKIITLFN